MNDKHGIRAAERSRRSTAWQTYALLTLGVWLVISPLVLHDARVTAGVVSGLISGLALAALAGWAGSVRRPLAPWLIALAFGLWLLVAPSFWQFRDGVDTWGLVPIPSWEVIEPTWAAVTRAEWNSILAGLLTLALACSVLVAGRRRRRARLAPSTDTERPRHVKAAGEQR